MLKWFMCIRTPIITRLLLYVGTTRLLSPEIQVIMFSATWNDHVLKYATNIMHGKFNRIRLQVKHLVLKSIKALYLDCEDESDRFQMLLALYSLVSVSQSIIFVAVRLASFICTQHPHE